MKWKNEFGVLGLRFCVADNLFLYYKKAHRAVILVAHSIKLIQSPIGAIVFNLKFGKYKMSPLMGLGLLTGLYGYQNIAPMGQ